ncbi:SDR family NAD(P)-dependent oxidoreductase [Lacticaseibacillus pantheris]|uniref:SDR family NAD(P)-dependent oxidoreductase n=1 Tax=Lacticaseibacillus pantheris TaxID=171523 RepID=UPI0025944D87|nr:SDR family NAD(P)-dependent oxidoreductase [Lacticaseibacillus pantheris]WKF83915.1 SDR family NAD(P)-dependent oxidoreductase [Lacticaseibacillus pantheris]
MTDLRGQVVVVTGGSGGLGRAIGMASARRGATVVFLARRVNALRSARAEASALAGTPAYAYQLDVSDPVQIDAVWAQLLADVGGHVDVLVNAAGFGQFLPALKTDAAITNRMFRVNVLGLIYMTRLAGAQMMRQGAGHIINIGSMAGKIATPKSAVYAATKAAVIAYSNALRLELRHTGVNVTTVNPGPVATDFFTHAHAQDYADAIAAFTLNADKLADRIVRAFHRPVREVNAPAIMQLGAVLYPLVPRMGDWLTATVFNRK